jgi:hypothetical protein
MIRINDKPSPLYAIFKKKIKQNKFIDIIESLYHLTRGQLNTLDDFKLSEGFKNTNFFKTYTLILKALSDIKNDGIYEELGYSATQALKYTNKVK